MRRHLVALSALAAVLTGCAAQPSPEAQAYAEHAIALMDDGLFATGDGWSDAKQRAEARIAAADDISETYDTLRSLARLAGGAHSVFLDPDEAAASETRADELETPTVAASDGIGTLTLPAFNSGDDDLVRAYRDAALTPLDSADVDCGWIVDLRGNVGGNMFPMLAAVAPLLPDGPAVLLREPEGGEEVTAVVDGDLILPGGDVLASGTAYRWRGSVAVLTDAGTASAAEAVRVGFAGRAETRVFGVRTAGVPTGNVTHELDDGAMLVLTTSRMVDRDGRVYDSRIAPDEVTDRGEAPSRAAAWLAGACGR